MIICSLIFFLFSHLFLSVYDRSRYLLEDKDDEEDPPDRIDADTDRSYNDELIGKKLRILYETGWHSGTINYFNTALNEYRVSFENEDEEDYIKKEDIDGLKIVLVSDKDVSIHGRVRKKNDYKKMANI